MTQAILFDVDGVLIHGYHAREELRHCWDENLENDLGISRQAFKDGFIFKDFINHVLIGRMDLYDALEKFLPTVSYHDDPQIVIDYWLKHDSQVNHDLIDKIKILKSVSDVDLYIATNQEHNRAKYLMDVLGFGEYFINIFHSAKIGHIKPSQDYFVNVHGLLGNPNTPPILFDDTPAVVQGANDFGWTAYEFLSVEDLYKDDFVASVLR